MAVKWLNYSENDQQWREREEGAGGVRKHGWHREEDRETRGMQASVCLVQWRGVRRAGE